MDTWRQGYGEDPRDWGGKVSRCAHDRGFNWGWSDPRSLPDALRCAARLSQDCAPVAPGAIATGFELQARPWFPVLMGAFCVVAVARIRRPLRLLALCVPAAPSVLALLAAIHDPDVRRLAPGFMFVPVLLGSAWALLSERTAAPDQRWARLQLPMWLGRGLRVAVVLLIVLGLIPTWLSPAAPWRTPVALTAEWMQSARGERGSTAYDAACAKELIREQAGGEPFQGNTGARWQGYPTRAPRR